MEMNQIELTFILNKSDLLFKYKACKKSYLKTYFKLRPLNIMSINLLLKT